MMTYGNNYWGEATRCLYKYQLLGRWKKPLSCQYVPVASGDTRLASPQDSCDVIPSCS
jgi:hypothetical protein